MPVAFVASGASTVASGGTATISGLTVTGSDRLVTAHGFDRDGDASAFSCTCGGNAMTDSGAGIIEPNFASGQAWYLTESGLSAASSQDVVLSSTGGDTVGVVAMSHSGVADQAPESIASGLRNNVQSHSLSDTTITDNALGVAYHSKRNTQDVTDADGILTQREEELTNNMSLWAGEAVMGAAPDTVSIDMSWAANRDTIIVIMIFEEAAAAAAASLIHRARRVPMGALLQH